MSVGLENINKILCEGDLTFCPFKLVKCDRCHNENNPVFITTDNYFICIPCASIVISGGLMAFPGLNIQIDFNEVVPRMKKIGLFYYPASKHYLESNETNPVNVICDNCNLQHLPASFGYGRFDLCPTCFYKIFVSNSIY